MSGKILIVDDEPFNLDLLEQELADYDYVIERASDGAEALEKIDSFRPDIVLLDYMMPNMDGLEVITKLRQDERHQSLPVIFLTAKGTKEDIAKGLNAGADDYITKPFEPVELLARVRSMMRIKQMHDSLDDWNRNLESKVQEQVTHIERMGRLKRYLSPQIAETILNEEGDDLFATHRREVTVVFIDLRGFTNFSDSAEPEEVIDFLRGYHAEMGKLIFEHEGTLEHFAGDGIMVFFNDPIPRENHTEMAIRMALKIQERVKNLRPDWQKTGYDLDVGIGLAAGYATLGTIGFEGRMDYGAIGNVTIMASRLSSEAKGGQVLTNQKTAGKVNHVVEAESVGDLQLKGFARPVAGFEITALKNE